MKEDLHRANALNCEVSDIRKYTVAYEHGYTIAMGGGMQANKNESPN